MIQFRGSNWGEALGSGLEQGIRLGKQFKTAKAGRDYESGIKEDTAARDAAYKAADELKATNGDESAWQASRDKADRDFNYAKQKRQVDYHTYLGNVAEADAANTRLDQMKFRDNFYDEYKKDPARYDKDILNSLNNGIESLVNKRTFSMNDKGQMVVMQDGKMLGNPIEITPEMRNQYVDALYAQQYNQKFGGTPDAMTRNGWKDTQTALGDAIRRNNAQSETVRHNLVMEDLQREGLAIKRQGSRGTPAKFKFGEANDNGLQPVQDSFGRIVGFAGHIPLTQGSDIREVYIPAGMPQDKYADTLRDIEENYGGRVDVVYDRETGEGKNIITMPDNQSYGLDQYPAIVKKYGKSSAPQAATQTTQGAQVDANVQEPPRRAVPITVQSPMGGTMTVGPDRTFRDVAEAGAKWTEEHGKAHPLVGAYHKLNPNNEKESPRALHGGVLDAGKGNTGSGARQSTPASTGVASAPVTQARRPTENPAQQRVASTQTATGRGAGKPAVAKTTGNAKTRPTALGGGGTTKKAEPKKAQAIKVSSTTAKTKKAEPKKAQATKVSPTTEKKAQAVKVSSMTAKKGEKQGEKKSGWERPKLTREDRPRVSDRKTLRGLDYSKLTLQELAARDEAKNGLPDDLFNLKEDDPNNTPENREWWRKNAINIVTRDQKWEDEAEDKYKERVKERRTKEKWFGTHTILSPRVYNAWGHSVERGPYARHYFELFDDRTADWTDDEKVKFLENTRDWTQRERADYLLLPRSWPHEKRMRFLNTGKDK